MTQIVLLFIFAAFFALNMGGSTFPASFAAARGGGVLSKWQSQLLFLIFVLLGAVFLGKPVSTTLGEGLVNTEILTLSHVTIILFSAGLSLFLANLLHLPQSTSLVTVTSILGVGFYYQGINTDTLLRLIPFWILLPLGAYLITLQIGRLFYPPRAKNLWIYEKVVNQKTHLKNIVILASCYNAFSIGANNVANVAGPITATGLLDNSLSLLLAAPLFGLGGAVFHKTLDSTSEKIVPLGLFAAALISTITGTVMIIASIYGVPQSFVQVKIATLMAIGSLKNGPESFIENSYTKKTYISWLIMPIIAFIISLLLTILINKLT